MMMNQRQKNPKIFRWKSNPDRVQHEGNNKQEQQMILLLIIA